MRVIINTLIHLDENERRIVEEALRPYRVHTEVLNLPTWLPATWGSYQTR